ncbi:MAG: hypothetical protein Q4E09_04520 [Eubacteriales bacterium]|nr:hypothetical protein [Eubacteriales bacterium]
MSDQLALQKTARPALVLALWQFKRNLFLAILPALAQLLIFAPNFMDTANTLSDPNQSGFVYYGRSLFFLYLIPAIILVHRHFSFLHKQAEANLVLSLPAKRLDLYGALWLSLLVNLVLARLLSLLQNIFYAGSRQMPLGLMLRLEGETLLRLIAVAAFLIFFYVSLANSFNAQILAAVINLCYFLLYILWGFYTSSMLPGYGTGKFTDLAPYLLAPYLSGLGIWADPPSAHLIYWLCFSLLFALLSAYFFQKREAEQVGQDSYMNGDFIFARALSSLAGGLTLGMLFNLMQLDYGVTEQENWLVMIVGFILGVLLVTLVADLIFQRGEVPLGKSLLASLFNLIPLALIMAVLAGGAFGYTDKRPTAARTEEVLLRIAGANDPDSFSDLFYLNWSVVIPIEKSDTTDLVIRDTEQIDRIAKLMGYSYQEKTGYLDYQGALGLPRNLTTQNRLREDNERNYGANTAIAPIKIGWKDKGSLGAKQRTLTLYLSEDDPIYPDLIKDPGLELLFLRAGANVGIQEFSIEEIKPEPTNTCQRDNSNQGEWAKRIRHLAYMRTGVPYPSVRGILRVVQQDYNELSEAERIVLAEKPELVLKLKVYEQMRDSALTVENLQDENSPFVRELVLPLSSNFQHLGDYIDQCYREYQKERGWAVTEDAPAPEMP